MFKKLKHVFCYRMGKPLIDGIKKGFSSGIIIVKSGLGSWSGPSIPCRQSLAYSNNTASQDSFADGRGACGGAPLAAYGTCAWGQVLPKSVSGCFACL